MCKNYKSEGKESVKMCNFTPNFNECSHNSHLARSRQATEKTVDLSIFCA